MMMLKTKSQDHPRVVLVQRCPVYLTDHRVKMTMLTFRRSRLIHRSSVGTSITSFVAVRNLVAFCTCMFVMLSSVSSSLCQGSTRVRSLPTHLLSYGAQCSDIKCKWRHATESEISIIHVEQCNRDSFVSNEVAVAASSSKVANLEDSPS